jgi:hypothetical protein
MFNISCVSAFEPRSDRKHGRFPPITAHSAFVVFGDTPHRINLLSFLDCIWIELLDVWFVVSL